MLSHAHGACPTPLSLCKHHLFSFLWKPGSSQVLKVLQVLQVVSKYKGFNPFPLTAFLGHFQPLQALNVLSFQFPLAVGLETSPRGHFSYPKQICGSSHTHYGYMFMNMSQTFPYNFYKQAIKV